MTTPPPLPLLTPAVIRREGSRFLTSVQGIQTLVASSKPEAVSSLCVTAIERHEKIVVTLIEGAGTSYLVISEYGQVSPSTAPAPSSVRPDLTAAEAGGDLGQSTDDDTRAWVEATMLDVEPAPVQAKKRFRLGRRR